jgi:osmotically-inducible protein OsmY
MLRPNSAGRDPDIKSDDIAVAVDGGVATLTGFVRSYGQRREAESDAKCGRRCGSSQSHRSASADNPSASGSGNCARRGVGTENGWVTLEGQVEWNYERERTEDAVRCIRGVKGITNSVQLRPHAMPFEVKHRTEEESKRDAQIDASKIIVEAHSGHLILHGSVRSWTERREAERVAWEAPGVTSVDNRITIGVQDHAGPSPPKGYSHWSQRCTTPCGNYNSAYSKRMGKTSASLSSVIGTANRSA